MISARFHLLRARLPVRHARVGLCRVGDRARVECLRVGRCFARSQCVRLRLRHAHLLVLRARLPVRHARPPVCRVGTRVRVECLRGCAEDGGGSGTRGSIGMGRGGEDEAGTAHDRLLVALGRRSALLPLTDDGRGGVARAGPFSTLGKGDYRGMGSFILFFSFLFCSGGARIGKIARGIRLLGGLVFHFGGRALGVGRFVFALGGCALGSDRSGGKRARGVRLLGGRVFGVSGRDCIWARRGHLLGGVGVPFGGCFLLGGGQGVVFRQAAHGTAVGFARRAHPTLPHRAHRAAARRRAIVRQHAAHRGEHRRGESARRAVDVEETEIFHHAPHRGGVLVEVEGQHVVVERRAAVATVAQVREQHDVDADARSAHTAAQTAAVADAEGARIEREIGGEKGHERVNVFLNV